MNSSIRLFSAVLVIVNLSACRHIKVFIAAKPVPCEVVDLILNHPDVAKILFLQYKPYPSLLVRVFDINAKEGGCVGKVAGWNYKIFNKLRPSLNTGYHRDVVIQKKTKTENVYWLYLPSYKHADNRQTTYLLEFKYDRRQPRSVELVGFGEYTDQ